MGREREIGREVATHPVWHMVKVRDEDAADIVALLARDPDRVALLVVRHVRGIVHLDDRAARRRVHVRELRIVVLVCGKEARKGVGMRG